MHGNTQFNLESTNNSEHTYIYDFFKVSDKKSDPSAAREKGSHGIWMNHGSGRRNKDTKGRSVSIIQDKRMRKKVVTIWESLWSHGGVEVFFQWTPDTLTFQAEHGSSLPSRFTQRQTNAGVFCLLCRLPDHHLCCFFLPPLLHAARSNCPHTDTQILTDSLLSPSPSPSLSFYPHTNMLWVAASQLFTLLCDHPSSQLLLSPSPYITGWAMPRPTN